MKTDETKANRTPLLAIIKNISFFILSSISIALSVYLFLQFSPDPIESYLFAAVAIAFEGTKIYALVDGHKEWVNRRRSVAVTKISMYLVLAALSVIASYGFSLGALQRADLDPQSARVSQRESSIERQLDELNTEIDAAIERRTELPQDWITIGREQEERIQRLRDERRELEQELVELDTGDFDVATNAFNMIGESIGVDGQTVMFYLLIILAIAIELNIVFTSPEIKPADGQKKHKHEKPKSDWNGYVNISDLQSGYPKWDTKTTYRTPREKEKEFDTDDLSFTVNSDAFIASGISSPVITSTPSLGEAEKKKLEPETKEEPKEPPKRKPSKMVQEDNFKKVVQTIVKEFFEDPEDPNSTYLSPMQEVVDRVYKKDLKPLHDLGIVTRGAVERLVSKIWEAMKHSTGPTGYKFVSYDKDHRAYTPNYTAALITKHLIKRMHIPQK